MWLCDPEDLREQRRLCGSHRLEQKLSRDGLGSLSGGSRGVASPHTPSLGAPPLGAPPGSSDPVLSFSAIPLLVPLFLS